MQSVGNKLKAIRNFLKIPLTVKIDPDAIERQRDHVLLKSPTFVHDSPAWRETHDPDAGYVAHSIGGGDGAVSVIREMSA